MNLSRSITHRGRMMELSYSRVAGSGVPKIVRGQLQKCRDVGANRLACKLVPTLEQRAVVNFRQVWVEVGHQGSQGYVIGDRVDESADGLVGVLAA